MRPQKPRFFFCVSGVGAGVTMPPVTGGTGDGGGAAELPLVPVGVGGAGDGLPGIAPGGGVAPAEIIVA